MSLLDVITTEIRTSGPMRLDRYMSLCLTHPEYGYYKTADPLGRDGDFITAPEVSQMFGEVIGLAIAQAWIDQGQPSPFVLAELGPGRGTLMADVLRVASRVPGFTDAATLCLVETNPVLRVAQAEAVGAFNPRWLERMEDLPDGAIFLLGNEFIDALPIRQFQRTGGQWHETMIGAEGMELRRGLGPPADPPDAGEHRDGDIVEINVGGIRIAGQIGARLHRFGGLAILIDYGSWDGTGDTFQALARHQTVDPLTHPGEADLTAHVRFAPLADAARRAGANPYPLLTQGAWLQRIGIGARAAQLVKANPARTSIIEGELTRLTGAEQMGTLFKVLAMTGHGARTPPGFEETH